MRPKRNRTPIDLRTRNRDLLKAPAVLKARHINTGRHSRIVLGPDWVSNGRWTVRRLALSQGLLLSPEWLRVSEPRKLDGERHLLLSTIFGLKPQNDVRFEVTLRDEKQLEELRRVEADTLKKYTRTRARYSEDYAEFVVFRADDGTILGIDGRWVDVFALDFVWRSETGPIVDNLDPERINVFFPTSTGKLPEEASFASYAGGYVPERTEQP
jgi:hypothetical protein